MIHSIIHSCEDVISWDKYDLQLLIMHFIIRSCEDIIS